MSRKIAIIEQLSERGGRITDKRAIVGFDGFVDTIMSPIDQRTGQGSNFVPISTIESFGERIMAAAGKSANIEMYPQMEKIGGNGPIMANALLSAGAQVRYIGALGERSIHPVFQEMAKRTEAVSLCDPGFTNALEFQDGKLLLGIMSSLDQITYERIIEKMGEGVLFDCLSRSDLIAMVNWTMIPNMTTLFNDLLSKVFPHLGPRERLFFFDLTDPRKRSSLDLRSVLSAIQRFQAYGQVTLGLNLAEAMQVYEVLGYSSTKPSARGLQKMASRIRKDMDISMVVIHPIDSAACADRDDSYWVAGPYTDHPKIATGAGDHFNAGFSIAQLLEMDPEECLMNAVGFSGYYVRSGKSPSLTDVSQFLQSWSSGVHA